MSKWNAPQVVTQLDRVFGGKISELLPSMGEIPGEFSRPNNPWVRCISTWFFQGLGHPKFDPKPGIDETQALEHIQAIMVSFEPKHERKEAGCAYLMSLWFREASGTAVAWTLKPTRFPQNNIQPDGQTIRRWKRNRKR